MQVGNYRFDPDMAMNIGEKVVSILVILLVTWALAKAAKWAFAKLVDNVGFLQRNTETGASLGTSLGKIVGLLIWLFGLMAILSVLGLDAVAGPINSLLENVVSFLPNVVMAGIVLFIGLMLAGIVRDIVITALQTMDFDKWANRGGVETATGNSAISKTIGIIVYVLIVIPIVIIALDVLAIESISVPASNMLNLIFLAIPRIIVAAILLGIGYLISKFVVGILTQLLAGLGVDRSLASTEMLPAGTTASGVIARVVQVAIILFFAIAATRQLGFPELTNILEEVLALGGNVAFGAVVIAVGFLLANMLSRLVGGAEGGTAASSIVKWATIVLFTFMGLQFTGVGEIITATAFSALVIGAAVAGALAFGLGGREWAGRKLEEWDGAASGTTKPKAPAKKKAAPKDNAPLPPGA